MQIVKTLCPPFTVSGATVQCTPVANYPLGVQVEITPTQEGTGDPSPTNVRPIVGWDAITIHQSNGDQDNTYTVQLGQTVYGGTLDVGTGTLTVTHAKRILNGSENWANGESYNGFATQNIDSQFAEIQICTCNIAVGTLSNMTDGFSVRIQYDAIRFQGFASLFQDVDSFKSYIQGQNAEIVAKLATPFTIQLDPQQITSISGTNTIYTDAGAVTVSGLSDPAATIASLQARVSALESAQTNM